MDNQCKVITCTSMERTNLRQFIIVIKKNNNNKNNMHVSLPKGTKSTTLTVSRLFLQLQTSRVYSHSQPLLCFSHYLLKFSPTKPIAFSRLCGKVSCVKTSEFSRKFSKVCRNFFVSLQFMLNQYALILSKQTLIS